jgi:hypothetical protein
MKYMQNKIDRNGAFLGTQASRLHRTTEHYLIVAGNARVPTQKQFVTVQGIILPVETALFAGINGAFSLGLPPKIS